MLSSLKFTGRKKLYTYLTPEQLNTSSAGELIKEDLVEYILPLHFINASEEQYLFDYYAGYHPNIANRVKETRGEINNKMTINFAKSFTRDIVSYFLGKPVQYVHRDVNFRKDSEALANAFDAESKNLVDHEIASDMSICGVGYRGIFPDTVAENGTHLCIVNLDPRLTFVVHSPDKTKGALYCGTMYATPPNPRDMSSKSVYTIYTKTKRFTFECPGTGGVLDYSGLQLVDEKSINLGNNLPIIEYDNSVMMIGDWESELSMMDAMDILGSDSINDVVQFVNSLLLAQGFELDEETLTTLEENKILNIPDVPPGVTIDVRYIAEQLDSDGVESLRQWLETTMRSIVGVPSRGGRASGGGADTGEAVYLRDGWQDIDLVATAKEQFFIDADRKALATAVYILRTFNEVSNDLKPQDIEIKFSRNKQVNLQAKAQAYSTMVGARAPIAPIDALEFADLTTNIQDVTARGEEFAAEQRELQQQMFATDTSFSANSNGNYGYGYQPKYRYEYDEGTGRRRRVYNSNVPIDKSE